MHSFKSKTINLFIKKDKNLELQKIEPYFNLYTNCYTVHNIIYCCCRALWILGLEPLIALLPLTNLVVSVINALAVVRVSLLLKIDFVDWFCRLDDRM